VLALREDYLDGSVRPGSNLATTYVSSSNTYTLPAKTYERTDPLGVLQDVAFQTHKQFFVTIDKELFYDGWDSSAYACPFRISDDEAELRTSPTTTLGIVPDSGPLFAINGQRFIDGIRLYYGAGPTDYVDVTHPGLSSAKAHWRETVYAPESITNATEAANLAETILQERSQDGRTFMLSVCHANGGPLTDAQVGSIKPGMLISIKARVLPFFLTNGQPNYTYYSTRIVSLQWHMPLPGQYFATLKLERPEKLYGVGVKPGPTPAGGSAPTVVTTALGVNNAAFLTIPDGLVNGAIFVCLSDRNDAADTTAITYDPNPGDPGPTYALTKVPGSEVDHATVVGPRHEWWYLLDPVPSEDPDGGGVSRTGGTAANMGVFLLQNVDPANPYSGFAANSGTSFASSLTLSAGAGQLPLDAANTWTPYDNLTQPDHDPTGDPVPSGTLAWTDMANNIGHAQEIGGSYGDSTPAWTFTGTYAPPWLASGLVINNIGSTTEPVGDAGDPGTDTGQYANPDHTHAHGQLSEPSDAHDAADISVVPFSTIAATTVQAALEEVLAEAGGAPIGADYLVGTANGSLSAEIVVGTTPGGELGGTWASPTVDTVHSGSAHAIEASDLTTHWEPMVDSEGRVMIDSAGLVHMHEVAP
jgi:hypothetical protein